MRNILTVAAWLLVTAVVLVNLTGCSINVVVAPGATVAFDSLNERNHQSAVQNNDSPDLIRLLGGEE